MSPVNRLVGRNISTNLQELQNPQVNAIGTHPREIEEKQHNSGNVKNALNFPLGTSKQMFYRLTNLTNDHGVP